MPIIDANIILRYLLNDHPAMSEKAKQIILAGAQTTVEVLAEAVYVLKGVYHVERKDIAGAIEAFAQEVTIPHRTAIIYACKLFGLTSLDFVDCVLAGYHHIDGTKIETFDKKLNTSLAKDFLSEEKKDP